MREGRERKISVPARSSLHVRRFACALFVFCLAAGAAVAPQETSPAQQPASTSPPSMPLDPHVQEQRLGLVGPANPKLPTLFLVGDSTVRNGHGNGAGGLWGWGDEIAPYFDTTKINVVNRAIGGLSSHTYISGGHWADTLELMKPGDVVLIQFGHNDGGVNLPGAPPVPDQGLLPGTAPPPGARRPPSGRGSLPGIGNETLDFENPITHQHETIHTFGWYLRKYVVDTRAKGATPILCSLIPRKLWMNGKIVRNASTYAGWTREVAEQEHVGFVDLNNIIASRYDAMGEAAVDPLFGDPHTHTTLAGAQLNAECVIAGLKALPHDPLAGYFSARGRAVPAYVAGE